MNLRVPLALLFALGPVLIGCFEDRPLLFVVDGGAGSGPSSGQAGAGGGGPTGAAGDGAGGAGGVPLRGGCDIQPLLTTKYTCTLVGACHDAQGSAAGLNLASPGLELRLLGPAPNGGGVAPIVSMCAGQGRVYLIPGSQPAAGLFLDKINGTAGCGMRMPVINGPMSPTDLACFQEWANAVTAP